MNQLFLYWINKNLKRQSVEVPVLQIGVDRPVACWVVKHKQLHMCHQQEGERMKANYLRRFKADLGRLPIQV